MKEAIRQALNERGFVTVEQQMEQQRLETEKARADAETAKAEAEAARAEVDKVEAGPRLEMTPEQLQALMAQMMQLSTQAAVAAVQELKKPGPEELAAKEAKRLQEEKNLQMMVETAAEEKRHREAVQNSCSHHKQNGLWNYGGQVHSNARVILICKRCQKTLVDRPALPEDYQQGPLELLIENEHLGISIQ